MRLEERDIESSIQDWERLADAVRAAPFMRPGWIRAWWQAFGSGTLQVLTVCADGRVTGVLPFVSRGTVVRSPTNSQTPLFGFLAEDHRSARLLAEALLARRSRHLDLSFLAGDDPGFRSLREQAELRRFRTLVRPVLLSAYVDTEGDWGTYQASLDSKLRSEVRRRLRRLGELGEVRLEVVNGGDRLSTLLEEGFRIEESGWKGAHGTAINSDPRTCSFYSEVARWADERGWLQLGFVRIDSRAIAFDLCLEAEGVHFLLKTGFDHDFRRFGPGLILRSMMLERAFAGPIHTYEFLGTIVGANNRWKLDWTDRYRERVRFEAFPRSLAGTMAWSSSRYGPPLADGSRRAVGRVVGRRGRDFLKRGIGLIRKARRR
jgi:CelD/BcsL family acetyltransferase involved in cellulose biosynthesis